MQKSAAQWRVKILCLVSRIEPVLIELWLKKRLSLLEERPCIKGWMTVYAVGASLLGQCAFPQMLGLVVSKGSQLSLVQSIGYEKWELPCSGDHALPDPQLLGLLEATDWLTDWKYKGMASLPQVGTTGCCHWYSSMKLFSSWGHTLAYFSFPVVSCIPLTPSPKSTPLLNHFHKWFY